MIKAVKLRRSTTCWEITGDCAGERPAEDSRAWATLSLVADEQMIGLLRRILHPGRCHVHGQPLQRDLVWVCYGLIRLDAEENRARKRLFPNARSSVLGGCVVGRLGERMEVRFCPACRAAEASWRREHPDFNRRSSVFVEVEHQRRDLPESAGKRLLRDNQVKPRHLGNFSWVVYCLPDGSKVSYEARRRIYRWTAPNLEDHCYFENVKDLVAFLNRGRE